MMAHQWEPDFLLHSVSHELNTALTTVLGNAHILRSKGDSLDPNVRAGALSDLEEHAERLFSAIQNMLLLARVEMGEEPLLEPVVLSHLLAELVGQDARRISGEIRMGEIAVSQPVAVDRNLFKVILRNLFENACLYGENGPVEIWATEMDGYASITIQDHGSGVEVQERELIFEPFYRSPAVRDSVPGLGLGLTVAKRLALLHGGDIQIADSDMGATFIIRLPTINLDT